jgi:hypothetical protein
MLNRISSKQTKCKSKALSQHQNRSRGSASPYCQSFAPADNIA